MEPGAEPGAGGYKDTLNDDYDNSNIRTDINIIQPVFEAIAFKLPSNTKYNSAPQLPYNDHPYPSLQNLSNKFRQKGPNKIMYPPKNGPVALMKKYGGDPLLDLPPFDPFDELTYEIEQATKVKYSHELRSLHAMQHTNELQNIRALNRNASLHGAQAELATVHDPKYKGIFIGDRVVRGPDWKWGQQDGDATAHGTVRGLRQWHPHDAIDAVTEAVVLWDHGLYGNYRYNYRGAYDVRVVARLNIQSINMEPVCVGDTVCRRQHNWRWGDQDGGIINNESYNGTIIQLYASPAPFEGGARIAVCWDKDKEKWGNKAKAHKEWKESEQKENDGKNDLSLEEFEYVHVSDDEDNKDEEKEKQEDDDGNKEAEADIEATVLPSSTGKGACLLTNGITTDDPWSMNENYTKWNSEHTANWIRELNDEFDEYGDVVEQCGLHGNNFEEFRLMSFWLNKINVINEAHAKALAAACKYRIDQYELHKDNALLSDDNDNDNNNMNNDNNPLISLDNLQLNDNNNNNNNNVEQEAPPAFQIPAMDLNYLSPFLRAPQDSFATASESEGGEGGDPGFTDDEEGGMNEVIPAAAAAPAFSDASHLEPGAGAMSSDINNKEQVMKPKHELDANKPHLYKEQAMKPNFDKRKKLYFWQKVVLKEKELMRKFAEKRPAHEYFHITHNQYALAGQRKHDDDEKIEHMNDEEEEYEWKEPDFDELLSKPIAKYRWGIQYNYDLQIDKKKEYTSSREYLMIDDRVQKGKDFTVDEKVGDYKSEFGIVLKIEQWDDTRLEQEHVKGDKIYLTWSSFRPFRFNYNNAYDIEFHKRGQVFAHEFSHIRVGDIVSRGFSWTDDVYNNEDGGQHKQGIVVAVQYVLQVTGIIAKVIWHKNKHINLYAWGFKKVYDLRVTQ